MRKLVAAALAAACLMPASVQAKVRYETFESRNAIREGQGGSKVTKDGVDFWTTGDPPRRYQIIGMIRDNRGTGPLHGNAIGSSGIAKKILEVGGNAAVMLDRNSTVTGALFDADAGWGALVRQNITVFAVVKYLD